MNAHIETRLSISPDHPALPGHFPGQPVVPGVVLLDHLIEATEAALARPVHVTGLPQVKFLAPLLPGEAAHAVIDVQPAMPRKTVDRVQDITNAADPAPQTPVSASDERVEHASQAWAIQSRETASAAGASGTSLNLHGAVLSLRFRIERDGAVIAQGAFTLTASHPEAGAP